MHIEIPVRIQQIAMGYQQEVYCPSGDARRGFGS